MHYFFWKIENSLEYYAKSCFSISPGGGFFGFGVVDEEVSQGVDGVVVEAVLEGQLARGTAGFGIVIAFQRLNQSRASGRNDKSALAVAGADGPTDKLDAFQN